MTRENTSAERGLTIAIVNLMPFPESYQHDLELKLKAADPLIRLAWLKLSSKKYSTAQSDLSDYQPWQHLDFSKFDAAIITGAPVEKLSFEDIDFWPELSMLINRLMSLDKPLLGLCWGALAIGHMVGLRSAVHRKKIFGIFHLADISDANKNMAMPFSTYASFELQSLHSALNAGTFSAHYLHPSPTIGIVCLASQSRQLTLCLGHPEYSAQRLTHEWERDQHQQLTDVELPVAFTTELLKGDWLNDCTLFFKHWIFSATRYCQKKSLAHHRIDGEAMLETNNE